MQWTICVKVIRLVSTADLPEANRELERVLQGRDASHVPTLSDDRITKRAEASRGGALSRLPSG